MPCSQEPMCWTKGVSSKWSCLQKGVLVRSHRTIVLLQWTISSSLCCCPLNESDVAPAYASIHHLLSNTLVPRTVHFRDAQCTIRVALRPLPPSSTSSLALTKLLGDRVCSFYSKGGRAPLKNTSKNMKPDTY
eukprot:6472525-Amphidinium_carterae.1